MRVVVVVVVLEVGVIRTPTPVALPTASVYVLVDVVADADGGVDGLWADCEQKRKRRQSTYVHIVVTRSLRAYRV